MSRQQSLLFDNETIEQAKFLAEKWGLPPIRHFTSVVARAIERAFLAEAGGIKIENLTGFPDKEMTLLFTSLLEYQKVLQKRHDQTIVPENKIPLQEDIDTLQAVMDKVQNL